MGDEETPSKLAFLYKQIAIFKFLDAHAIKNIKLCNGLMDKFVKMVRDMFLETFIYLFISHFHFLKFLDLGPCVSCFMSCHWLRVFFFP